MSDDAFDQILEEGSVLSKERVEGESTVLYRMVVSSNESPERIRIRYKETERVNRLFVVGLSTPERYLFEDFTDQTALDVDNGFLDTVDRYVEASYDDVEDIRMKEPVEAFLEHGEVVASEEYARNNRERDDDALDEMSERYNRYRAFIASEL